MNYHTGVENIITDSLLGTPVISAVMIGIDPHALAVTQETCPEVCEVRESNSSSLSLQVVQLLLEVPPLICEVRQGHPLPFLSVDVWHTAFDTLHSKVHPGIYCA